MNTKYRAQILLEPEQHQALVSIARRQERSISEVVRQIISEYLDQQDEVRRWERRAGVLANLDQLRARVEQQSGVYPGDLLAEVRAGEDQDIDRIWRGEA